MFSSRHILPIVLVAMISSKNSFGDSWIDIEGKTRDGWNLSVSGECCRDGETHDSFRSMIIYLRKVDQNGKQKEIAYPNEQCELIYTNQRRGETYSSFRCKGSGKSPLAGVTYESSPGQTGLVLICKSGCGPASNAPLKLIRPEYEN